MTKINFDLDQIHLAASIIMRPGYAYEMRVLTKKGASTGVVDNADDYAQAAARQSGQPGVKGVYLTLNPVNPATCTITNTLGLRATAAGDSDILCRFWLPLDFDPIRKPGTNSTNEELQLAIAGAETTANYLKATFGFPEPLRAISGNGAHLLYRIDLPNDEASTKLISKVLHNLHAWGEINVPGVDIDTANSNAARIWKAYGTKAAKAEHTDERPQRLAEITSVPDTFVIVTPAQLQMVADQITPLGDDEPAMINFNSYDRAEVDAINAVLGPQIDIILQELYGGDIEEASGGQKRILGHKGMIGDPQTGKWYIHDSSGWGGDPIEAYGYRMFDSSWNRNNGTMFAEAKKAAGERAGITTQQAYIKPITPLAQPAAPGQPVSVPALNLYAARPLPRIDDKFHKLVIDCLYRGEVGDSELLAALYGDRLHYSVSNECWYFWDGQRWHPDELGLAINLVKDLARIYHAVAALVNGQAAKLREQAADTALTESEQTPEQKAITEQRGKLDKQHAKLIKRIQELHTLARMRNILKLLSSYPGIPVQDEQWDLHPFKLATPTGVIDLRTGQLHPGNPADLIRTSTHAKYTGLDTPAPTWEKFLYEIFQGDQELIAFLARALGWGITGIQADKVLFFVGTGRNGKSVLLETLGAVLGDIGGPVSKDVFVEQKTQQAGAANPHILGLHGKRIAYASETHEGARLNSSQLKHITGKEDILARPLFGNIVKFSPTHLPILSTNYPPRIDSDDKALIARLLVVRFELCYVEKPIEPNERVKDDELGDKLRQELPGILAWLVRGCLEWQRQGKKINPPASVLQATKDYQDSEDLIAHFFDEMCILKQGVSTPSRQLFTAFKTWVESGGQRAGSDKMFAERLERKGFKKRRTALHIVWDGIGLLDQDTPQELFDDDDGLISTPAAALPSTLKTATVSSNGKGPHVAPTPPTGAKKPGMGLFGRKKE